MTSFGSVFQNAVFSSVSVNLTAFSVFGSVFLHCVLLNVYDARNDVLPC